MSKTSKTNPQSKFGVRIADRMAELGLNAKQVSRDAGLNDTYVRDLLKAETPNPRLLHIYEIAKILKVDLNWFLEIEIKASIEEGATALKPVNAPSEDASITPIWDHILERNDKHYSHQEYNQSKQNTDKKG